MHIVKGNHCTLNFCHTACLKNYDVAAHIVTYFEMNRATVNSSATRIKKIPSTLCRKNKKNTL